MAAPPAALSGGSSGHRVDTSLPNTGQFHDHGDALHDHATDRLFHKHGGDVYHEHATDHYFRLRDDALVDTGHRSRSSTRIIYVRPYYDPYYWWDPFYSFYGWPYSSLRYRAGFFDYYGTAPAIVLHYQAAPAYVAPPEPVEPPGEAQEAQFTVEQIAALGVRAFRDGQYEHAERWLRHAVTKDPRNGRVWLLLAQTLFATKQFDAAAGATQNAMTLLPADQWGVVASNYRDYYGDTQHYVDQLKVLEQAVWADTASPALRLLLAFHYGWLGYPAESVREANELLKLSPGDALAQKLREVMEAKLPNQKSASPPSAAPATTPVPPPQ
jgi:tetratricopeptide (TPR) repeat protein